MEYSKIQLLTIWIIPVMFAITVHEAAHGIVAARCGDKTAYMLGRTSLNPIVHIDPIGTIIVPLLLFWMGGFVFGWAKPVPVIFRNLKQPKRDMAFVAAAGPLSNLIMALIWAGVAKLGILLFMNYHLWWGQPFYYMGMAGISINLILAILNMIPLPPLDGSKVLSSLLPAKLDFEYGKLEPYGLFILVALMASGILSSFIEAPYKSIFSWIAINFGLG